MKPIDFFTFALRIITAALAVYHLSKKQSKQANAAVFVLLLSFAPELIFIFFDIRLGAPTVFLYLVVLIMSLYLGSALKFYDRYAAWDRWLHFLSGITFALAGITLAGEKTTAGIFMTALFGFSFSIMLSALWEVGEFIADCILRGNAQRWQSVNASINHQPAAAIQPAGLVDSMTDLISGTAGALLACALKALMLAL